MFQLLKTLVALNRRAFCQDPFRFRPSRLRSIIFSAPFRAQCWYYLKNKFKTPYIAIDDTSIKILATITPKHHTLVCSNHVSYVDPYVLYICLCKANKMMHWMMGIEAYKDFWNSLYAESLGAFSVDRGILDRNALSYAQSILNAGEQPLIIFSEGEADYTNAVLRPFFDGTALFSLKTAKYLTDNQLTERTAQIIPMSIQYTFKDSKECAEKIVEKNFIRLETELQKRLNLSDSFSNASNREAAKICMMLALDYFEKEFNLDNGSTSDLQMRIQNVQKAILNQLMNIHAPDDVVPDTLDYKTLMPLKNKLRSEIARKVYAPSLVETKEHLKLVENLKNKVESNKIGLIDRVLIHQFDVWITGQQTQELPLDKHLQVIQKNLEQQLKYAEIKENASKKDLESWQRHLLNCRHLKLLQLLLEDFNRGDFSLEALDEMRFKIELLVFNRFNYVGPKTCTVKVHEPINTSALLRTNDNAPLRKLSNQLTQQLEETIGPFLGKS